MPLIIAPTDTLKAIERKAIVETLKRVGGSRKKTSEILDISLRTLQYKIKEYGITI
jgi:DNA-binding NtrC family response regulator